MAHDGDLEATGILARLDDLVGGRVYEDIADDQEISVGTDGECKPHIIVSFGSTVPKSRDRGLGVTEAGQPQIFPFSVTSVASSAKEARATDAAVARKLIGWIPSANNSGQIKGRVGGQFVTLNANMKPSRWHRLRYMESVVNLQPSADPS